MKSITSISKSDHPARAAFTLIELLAVLGMLALLAITLFPAHAAANAKSRAIQCLANLGQVMRAVTLYTGDNAGFYPPNPDDGNLIPGHNWCPGWAGPDGSEEFNPDILADPTRCLVYPYLGTDVSLFRCPSDPRVGIYRGTDPARQGTRVSAARTISMNQAVGTICPSFDSGGGHAGKPTLSVNGPWLDNQASHRRNRPWRTYGRTSEVVAPAPARLWVIIEEDPYSVNDASFGFGMNSAQWVDYPGTAHDLGGGMAFADGHAEFHKWMDNRTRVISGNLLSLMSVPGSKDWLWLSQRTSARAIQGGSMVGQTP
jgi:prepilin-type processing-associated H-X9-DG protein